MNKWNIVEAHSGIKVADMEESVVEAAGGSQTSGWLINVERGDHHSFDPRIPAFFAAYELTERITTWLDVAQSGFYTALIAGSVIGLLALCRLLYAARARRRVADGRRDD